MRTTITLGYRANFGSLTAIAVIATVGVVVELRSSPHLRASVEIASADLGIPGITKTYKPVLTNVGVKPVRVMRCNAIGDVMTRMTFLADAVQRWDESTNRWQTISGDTAQNFCKPAALSIISGKVNGGWLWPRQSWEAEEEATAARDGFHKGDKARFVVFLSKAGDFADSIATEPFLIDEEVQSDVDFKVKH